MTRLNDGEGTAGQLLKDKQLYENMNGAVTDLRALIAEIKKDPEEIPERESEHLLRVEAMARDEGAGAGSMLLAFILGAVSGAAVALLYAPASGRETREYLGEKAREARARAAEAAAKGREALNQGRETLTTAIERGREAYQQARRENA